MLNGGDDVPLGRRLGPGVRARLGLGVPSSAGAPGELTIRLVEDGPPIEGRIVDLEGRPVAGARVKVERTLVRRGRRPGRPGSRRPGSWASEGLWRRPRPVADERSPPRRPAPTAASA